MLCVIISFLKKTEIMFYFCTMLVLWHSKSQNYCFFVTEGHGFNPDSKPHFFLVFFVFLFLHYCITKNVKFVWFHKWFNLNLANSRLKKMFKHQNVPYPNIKQRHKWLKYSFQKKMYLTWLKFPLIVKIIMKIDIKQSRYYINSLCNLICKYSVLSFFLKN